MKFIARHLNLIGLLLLAATGLSLAQPLVLRRFIDSAVVSSQTGAGGGDGVAQQGARAS